MLARLQIKQYVGSLFDFMDRIFHDKNNNETKKEMEMK